MFIFGLRETALHFESCLLLSADNLKGSMLPALQS
jgi:hypothetical protein